MSGIHGALSPAPLPEPQFLIENTLMPYLNANVNSTITVLQATTLKFERLQLEPDHLDLELDFNSLSWPEYSGCPRHEFQCTIALLLSLFVNIFCAF